MIAAYRIKKSQRFMSRSSQQWTRLIYINACAELASLVIKSFFLSCAYDAVTATRYGCLFFLSFLSRSYDRFLLR